MRILTARTRICFDFFFGESEEEETVFFPNLFLSLTGASAHCVASLRNVLKTFYNILKVWHGDKLKPMLKLLVTFGVETKISLKTLQKHLTS